MHPHLLLLEDSRQARLRAFRVVAAMLWFRRSPREYRPAARHRATLAYPAITLSVPNGSRPQSARTLLPAPYTRPPLDAADRATHGCRAATWRSPPSPEVRPTFSPAPTASHAGE